MRVLIVGFGFMDSFRWVKNVMTEQGFVVETAESRAEALEKAFANTPDIVLCWRILVDGLGLTVATTLHDDARFAETKFIVEFYVPQLASDADESRRQRAEDWPWIYCIEPPATPASLVAVVKRVAKQKQLVEPQE